MRPAANLLPLCWLGRRVDGMASAHLYTAKATPLQRELSLLGWGAVTHLEALVSRGDISLWLLAWERNLLVESHGWKAWRRLIEQVLGTVGGRVLLTPPLAVPPSVVEEVRAIEFNVAQEHELIQREFFYTAFLDSPYPSEVTLMVCGDITSTLSKLEELGAQPASPSPQNPGPPRTSMSLSQGSPS